FKKRAARIQRAARFGSDINTLDRQGLQIRSGILGIEHLAVEEGLLAAGSRSRDVRSSDAERLGGLFPEILAIDLGDHRLGVEARVILAPADVLREEPEIVALERIGRMIAPVFHDIRRVFDYLARYAIVELAR